MDFLHYLQCSTIASLGTMLIGIAIPDLLLSTTGTGEVIASYNSFVVSPFRSVYSLNTPAKAAAL